jgi:short-subunit dehydrogenase
MDCNPSLFLYAALQSQAKPVSKKNIWIIGASSGIGRELAIRLAANDNNLILSARNKDKLEEVVQACRQSQANAKIQVHLLDVTNSTALLEAAKSIDCDICILNAGRGHLSLASETSAETNADMLSANCLWQMTLAPALHCRHVVVMSSIAAFLPVPLSAAYAASKHALQGYFKSLAAERSDLIVDLICPGPVDTDFHSHGKETITASGSSSSSNAKRPQSFSKSPLKMSVERCAELTVAAVSRSHHSNHGSTVWLCPQPTLTALYLEKILPDFVFASLMKRIAAKRIDLYRRGVDLYDPKSWK